MEEIKEILGPEHVIFKITEELVDSDEDGDILEKIGSLIDSNGFPTAESLFTADSTSASSSANSASVVDLKDSWKTQINNNVDTEAYIDILLNNPSIIDHSIADSTINAMDLPVEFPPLRSNVKKLAELKILPVISKGNMVTLSQADKDLPVSSETPLNAVEVDLTKVNLDPGSLTINQLIQRMDIFLKPILKNRVLWEDKYAEYYIDDDWFYIDFYKMVEDLSLKEFKELAQRTFKKRVPDTWLTEQYRDTEDIEEFLAHLEVTIDDLYGSDIAQEGSDDYDGRLSNIMTEFSRIKMG